MHPSCEAAKYARQISFNLRVETSGTSGPSNSLTTSISLNISTYLCASENTGAQMSAWWSFVRKPEAGSFALARLGRKRNPAAGSECGDVESVIIIIRIIRIITLLLLLLPPPSFKQQSVIMLIRAILLLLLLILIKRKK